MHYHIGSTVPGNWTITRQLGKGSFGQVFEVQKNDYGITTTSALKVIHIPPSPEDIETALSEGMDAPSVTAYFQGFVNKIVKEIAIMSSLKSHPNIVAYEDHAVLSYTDPIGWNILIRMELLIPLRDQQRQSTLSEKEVRQLGIDICRALMFCHKKGILHRDIKPDNIFVSEAGQYKLGDFGVARSMEAATQGMSKAGTENYMAPEIHRCEPSYGPNVDLYSLGLVLYQLMNHNRLPFLPAAPAPIRFIDRENALQKRMQDIPIPAPSLACKAFADVILKACSYDPKERYQTAEEMMNALEALQLAAPTPTPAVTKETPTVIKEMSAVAKDSTYPHSITITFPAGANTEIHKILPQKGLAEVWISRGYAEAVLADKITDARLRVSWTNGFHYSFTGNILKRILQEALRIHDQKLAPALAVCSRFPGTESRKDLTAVHILETSESEVPLAYLNGTTGILEYIGNDGKRYLQANMRSSAIYNQTTPGQTKNPFFHIHSELELRPKRLQITSGLAECGGKIPLPPTNGFQRFLPISSHSQRCPQLLQEFLKLAPGKTVPMMYYVVEKIIPHASIACWFPDDNTVFTAPDPHAATYELFDTIPCRNFYHYLEHGCDSDSEDEETLTEDTLSFFSSKKDRNIDLAEQLFEKNPCPILIQQCYPGGSTKEQIRNSESGAKAEVWVTRTFAQKVAGRKISDAAIYVHLTNGLYWSITNESLLYYMRELLHYGEVLARRIYPFIQYYQEDILIHLIGDLDDSVHLATLDGVHNIVRYYGTDNQWHMFYNTTETLSSHTDSTNNKNPFYGIQSCVYTPPEKPFTSAT